MATIFKLEATRTDSYFGGCPSCGQAFRYNLHKKNWLACLTHRLKWFVGTGLMSNLNTKVHEPQNRAFLATRVDAEPIPDGITRKIEGQIRECATPRGHREFTCTDPASGAALR